MIFSSFHSFLKQSGKFRLHIWQIIQNLSNCHRFDRSAEWSLEYPIRQYLNPKIFQPKFPLFMPKKCVRLCFCQTDWKPLAILVFPVIFAFEDRKQQTNWTPMTRFGWCPIFQRFKLRFEWPGLFHKSHYNLQWVILSIRLRLHFYPKTWISLTIYLFNLTKIDGYWHSSQLQSQNSLLS